MDDRCDSLADRCWQRACRLYPATGYAMPEPPWERYGFSHQGEAAWNRICELADRLQNGPLSVYIHVPFCRQSCLFCDCHRVRLDASDCGVGAYVDTITDDIRRWGELGALGHRSVTTVHFGGGTPSAIADRGLAEIVAACHAHLAVHDRTEWAIETTCAFTSERRLEQLQRLGFSRLHVGVQTLDAAIREGLGRRLRPDEVVARLKTAVEAGFVTSADVIYGLPGQSETMLQRTLDRIVDAGVHGISAYRLALTPAHHRFRARFPGFSPVSRTDFALLHHLERVLQDHGFRKNYFTHHARPADKNLYARQAVRGEDLLGVGASAVGQFGGAFYRCARLPEYVAEMLLRPAVIGLIELPNASRPLLRVEAQLMSGRITRQVFDTLHLGHLLDIWSDHGLLTPGGDIRHRELTAAGTWFIEPMLADLRDRFIAGLP